MVSPESRSYGNLEPEPGWSGRICEAEARGRRGWGGEGQEGERPHSQLGAKAPGNQGKGRREPRGGELTPGSRLLDTCLLLLTIHFLRVIYERTSLIRDGFIYPLLQMTDAAAKMLSPCRLKGSPPHPTPTAANVVAFFSGELQPGLLALLPSPQPVCCLSSNSSRRFKSTQTLGPGQWGAVAGGVGEHHLPGSTFVAFLRIAPGRYQESWLPGEGVCLRKKERPWRPGLTRPGFAETVSTGAGAGMWKAALCAGQDSSEQPFWLNWGKKGAAGKGTGSHYRPS